MLQKLVASVLVMIAFLGTAPAQSPPKLTDQKWDIHDATQSRNLEITVTFGFIDASGSAWFFTETRRTGQTEVSTRGVLILPPFGDGTFLRAYSDDSGLWYSWQWNGDHYDKVGGTENVRSYWPIH